MVAREMLRSAVLALAGAIVVVASARADSPQVTLALPSVNISFTALYLAEDLHLWAEQGLEVKTIVIPGVGTNNAVINGSVQFAIGSSDALTRAYTHGQHLQAIGAGVKKTMEWVMIRKEVADAAHFDPAAPLAERAKILKGRTIAITGVGSLPDAVLKSVAAEAGIGPSDIVTPTMLQKFRRHAVVAIVVIAAFLSPGDLVWTTLWLAVPLYALYEISVFVSAFIHRRKERRRARLDSEQSGAPA